MIVIGRIIPQNGYFVVIKVCFRSIGDSRNKLLYVWGLGEQFHQWWFLFIGFSLFSLFLLFGFVLMFHLVGLLPQLYSITYLFLKCC